MPIKFSCSREAETCIVHALQCLPSKVLDDTKFLFVCVDNSDARRLVVENYQGYEIIVISEFVVPRNWKTEDEWSKRYFNFVLLHEVGHALYRHKSPNSISSEANSSQETDANNFAYKWLNAYLASKKMEPFTENELLESQGKTSSERLKYLLP